MVRRSRASCVLRWICTSACALTAVAWAFTRCGGKLQLGNDPDVNLPRVVLVEGQIGISPGLGWIGDNPPHQVYLGYLHFPLLGVMAVLALSTVAFWLPNHRAPVIGRCENCGYDLTGNVSGLCPECGATAVQPSAER